MTTGFFHIVFDTSAEIVLSQALKEAGRNERVQCFQEDLSYGPIAPPDPTLRLNWMEAELSVLREEWDWIIESDEEFWSNALNAEKPRLVWISRRTAKHYAGFLEFVRRFAFADYRVIDLTHVKTPWCRAEDQTGLPHPFIRVPLIPDVPDLSNLPQERSDHIRRTLGLELGPLTPDRVLKQGFEENAQAISRETKRFYEATWEQLRAENAPLRILKQGVPTSVPIDFYDDMILSHITKKPQRAIRVIGEAMVNSEANYYYVLMARLRNLAKAGKVIGRGEVFSSPTVSMGSCFESEVQLPD